MPGLETLVLFTLLSPVGMQSAAPQTRASWPHWRGPERDGVSRESGWSVTGAEEPLWSLDLGLGYSCVSIEGGRLYTMGFDEEAGLDRIYCLDAATGEEHWRHAWTANVRANFHGGGTLTTPTLAGGRVYVVEREGKGLCLDAGTGEVIWDRDYVSDLGIGIPFHGFSCSPLMHGDRLYVTLGGQLVLLDADTGEVVWNVGTPGDGGYSNLAPFELKGRELLAHFSGRGLVVHDAGDGEQLWTHPWKSDGGGVNCATPIVIEDRVFISSAYNMGAALLRLGEGDSPEVLWESKRLRNKVSGCILWNEHVYGFDESMLKCFDLEGNEKWRVRGLGMGAPAIADGKLLVLSSKGELIIAEASPEGFHEEYRRKVLDGGVYWTQPVLLEGRIYCRNSLGRLVCLDHRSAVESAQAVAEAGGELAPDAAGLFSRHAALMGGETLRVRQSVRIEGEIEILGAGITRSPMTIRRMAPARWHLTYSLGRFGQVQRGFDGELGWVLDPFFGNELKEGAALLEMKETLGFLHGVDWRPAYASMETVGRATFGDRDCWEVATRTVGGTERSVYFDVETGFLAGRDAGGEALVVHAEWREFEGVHLPTRTTMLIADTGAEETYYVDEVVWDDVELSAFECPQAVLALLRTPQEIEAESRRLREAYAAQLGSYRADFPPYDGAAWTVHVEGGELRLDAGEQRNLVLTEPDEAGEAGEFGFPMGGRKLRFDVGEDGRVTKLVIRGGPTEVELPRIDE